jgi:hypothetical protein
MQNIQTGYRGLSLLVDINWERMLYPATVMFALMLGAWLGTLIN